MRARLWRALAIAAVLLAALVVSAGLVAHTSWARSRALTWAVTFLDGRYRLKLSARELDYNALTRRVTLDEIRLAARGHEETPFFTAKRVEVRLPRSVYSGILAIESLSIVDGTTDIVRDESGVSNLPPSGGGPTSPIARRIDIRAIALEKFNLRYIDRGRDLALAVPGIAASLRPQSDGATGPFKIQGQTTFRRHELTIALQPVEAQLTFDGSNVKLQNAPLRSSDLDATLTGDIRRVLDSPSLNLNVDGVVHLDQAIRWAPPPVPVSGAAAIRGTLTGAPSEIEIALDVSGRDLLVGRERGVAVQGPVRINPNAASSDGVTITPSTGGSIKASFDVPFTSSPSQTRAEWKGLDARTAFRLGDLEPVALGAAMDGVLTFKTGETRTLQVNNRATARTGEGAVAVGGTAEASLVGDRWRVKHAHDLPGVRIDGDLSGVINRENIRATTVEGPSHAAVSDVAEAGASFAGLGLPMAAIISRIHGALDVPASVSGRFNAPSVHATVSGDAVDVPNVGIVGLTATVDADSQKVTVNDLSATRGSATISGNLIADIDSRTWSGKLQLEADDVTDLESAVPEAWRIAGPAKADAIVGGSFDAIAFDTTVSGAGLVFAGRQFDSVIATATVTPSSIDVKSMELTQGPSVVTGRVSYNWDTGAYDANVDGKELSYVASLLSEHDTTVTGSGHFEGAGTREQLGGVGTAKFTVTGGTAGTLIGSGDLTVQLAGERATYAVGLPSLGALINGSISANEPYEYRAEGAFTSVPLAPLAALADAIEGQVEGTISLNAIATGRLSGERETSVVANLQELAAGVGGVTLRLASPARVSWERDELTVEKVELSVGKGKLMASGVLSDRPDRTFEGTFTGTVEDAAAMAHAFNVPTNLDGTGNVEARVSWSRDPNRTMGTLILRDGSIASVRGPAPVTGLEVDAMLRGRSLTVSKVAGHLATTAADGDFSAHVDADLGELTLETIAGEVVVDSASFTLSGVPVAQRRPARIGFGKSVVTVADLELSVAENPVVVSGTTTYAKGESALDLNVKGLTDLRVLSAFVPTVGFDGTGDVNLKVTGTVQSPQIAGRVQLADAEVALDDPRLLIADLNGPIELTGTAVVIEALQGTANGGAMTLDGRLDLEGLSITGGVLNIQAQGVAMEFPRGLRTEVDALLTFRPDPRAPTLIGDVRVLQGAYAETITLAGLATRGGAAAPSLGLAEEPSYFDQVRLNVSVTTSEDLVIDNNYGRMDAGASLRLVGTIAQPGMDGRITLREGGQLYIAGRTFRITRGEISFTDQRRIEPEFDIAAEARIGGDNVTMTLTGTLDKPSLDLSSETGGKTTGELAADILGGGVNGEVALTLLSADLLGVTGRAIGLDALRVEKGTQFNTDFREDPSLISDTTDPASRLTIAKRLNEQVEVTVSQNLRESGKTTFVVSYFPRQNFELRGLSQDNATLGIGLRHRITIGGAPVAPVERALPPIITAIRFADTEADLEALARKEIKLKAGDRLAFLDLQRDVDKIRELLQEQGYFEARVRTRRVEGEDPQHVILEFRIERGPKTIVEVRGIQLSRSELRELEQAWTRTMIFDRFLVDDLIQRVQRKLVLRGELNSVVLGSVIRDAQGSKRARIDVTPGIPVSGREIRFTGNQHFDANQLRAALATARIDLEPWFDPSVLVRPLRAFYSQQGYLNSEIKAGPLEVDGTLGVLPVAIVEGPQAQITNVTWNGPAEERQPLAERALQITPPHPFITADVNAARLRVEREYRTRGYNSVDVTVTPHVESPESVTLQFEVQEGPQQVLQEVATSGNELTASSVITEALRFRLGRPVNLDEWARARKRLYDTNVFRQVTINAVPTADAVDGTQPVRAQVSVQEYPPWAFRYGLQLEGDRDETLEQFVRKENLGVVAEIKSPNLFGRALTFGAFGQYEWDDRQATLFLATSRLFGWPARSSLFGSQERVRLRDTGGNLVALSNISKFSAEQRWRQQRGWQLVYGYRFERNHTYDPDPSPFDPFPLDALTNLGKLSTAVLWDRRDDPINSTSGTFSSASTDLSALWLGSDLKNRKLLLQQYVFVPIARRFVWATRAQYGVVFGPDPLLATDAFTAGGALSVRGYAEDSLGPRGALGVAQGGETLIVVNQEMRMPIYKWLRGVAFVDAGNIYGKDQPVNWGDLKFGYGFGLRIDTPVGLGRIDFGIPASSVPGVNRATNSTRGGRVYFGIGHIF